MTVSVGPLYAPVEPVQNEADEAGEPTLENPRGLVSRLPSTGGTRVPQVRKSMAPLSFMYSVRVLTVPEVTAVEALAIMMVASPRASIRPIMAAAIVTFLALPLLGTK